MLLARKVEQKRLFTQTVDAFLHQFDYIGRWAIWSEWPLNPRLKPWEKNLKTELALARAQARTLAMYMLTLAKSEERMYVPGPKTKVLG